MPKEKIVVATSYHACYLWEIANLIIVKQPDKSIQPINLTFQN